MEDFHNSGENSPQAPLLDGSNQDAQTNGVSDPDATSNADQAPTATQSSKLTYGSILWGIAHRKFREEFEILRDFAQGIGMVEEFEAVSQPTSISKAALKAEFEQARTPLNIETSLHQNVVSLLGEQHQMVMFIIGKARRAWPRPDASAVANELAASEDPIDLLVARERHRELDRAE